MAAIDAAGMEVTVFDVVDPNPTDVNIAAPVAALAGFGLEGTFCPPGARRPDRLLDPVAGLGSHRSLPATEAVPTTSGTASETNGGGLITDTANHRKLTFSHLDVRPRAVVLDPELTVGLPSRATAASGMDVLTHAIEGLHLGGARADPGHHVARRDAVQWGGVGLPTRDEVLALYAEAM